MNFLRSFISIIEAISGLKINRNKCSLIGLNVEDEWVEEKANVLGCSEGRILFMYLGI